MMNVLEALLRMLVWLLVAPLLPGIINKVKAWVAGRRGPPVLLPAPGSRVAASSATRRRARAAWPKVRGGAAVAMGHGRRPERSSRPGPAPGVTRTAAASRARG